MNFKNQLGNGVGSAEAWIAEISGSALMFLHDHWVLLMLPVAILIGSLGLSPLKGRGDEKTEEAVAIWLRRLTLYYAAFLILLPLPLVVIFQTANKGDIRAGIGTITLKLLLLSLWLIPATAAAHGIRLFYLRKISPKLSSMFKANTISQSKESLSDIRTIDQTLTPKRYVPEQYYKPGFIFFGLDEKDEPIYIDLDTYLSNHTQIMGKTGAGKGVLIGVILDQLIMQGITVFYSDPKHDEFIPHIMYQRCKKMGRRFTYFSFYDDEPGEWGPFLGGSLNDARERLGSAFGIGKDSGDNSSIHKARELRMTKNALNTTRTVDGLFQYCELEKEDSRITTELDIWKTYRSVCATTGGFSIGESLKRGDVVYIKGFIMDRVMKNGFKVMMMEAVQEAANLKKVKKPKAVWFWDEVSFYVVAELPQSLAAIRSAGVVMGIAYQSDQDMKSLEDQSINADYIYNAVNVNAQIKLVYGGWDHATAKFMSELCGTIYKEVTTMTEVEANSGAAETWGKKSTVTKEQEALFTENSIKRLPPNVCLFLQPGKLPKFCFTSFVPVEDFSALDSYLLTLPKPSPLALASVKPIQAPTDLSEPSRTAQTPPREAALMLISQAPDTPIAPVLSPFSSLVLPQVSAITSEATVRTKAKKKFSNKADAHQSPTLVKES